jgi:hypothetical protein
MFDQKDYYGNQYKWFIGKVKDVNDPLNSNRVRVHIFGIHPDEDLVTGSTGTVESSAAESTNQGFSVTPPVSLLLILIWVCKLASELASCRCWSMTSKPHHYRMLTLELGTLAGQPTVHRPMAMPTHT